MATSSPPPPKERGSAQKRDRDDPARAEEDRQILAAIKAVVSKIEEVSVWELENAAGAKLMFTEQLLDVILPRVRDLFLAEGALVRVTAPVHVCGDIHGQLHDLLNLFKLAKPPPEEKFLFLGDYVDRGKFGIECVAILMGYKCLYPDRIVLLRGNHETATVNRQYGFFEECKRKYSVRMWKKFSDVFMCLPLAATINDAILCMHGGISRELTSLRAIEAIQLPLEVGDTGLVCDLLWADPCEDTPEWAESDRGVSFLFGEKPLDRCLKACDLDLVVRAHQVMDHGYKFFPGNHDRKLVTVFSATNYCGAFSNCGGMLNVAENLQCTFGIIKPRMKAPPNFAAPL